ncbi:hypothetical protein IAU60_004059 [Kwoniella sp. DSM 27419]
MAPTPPAHTGQEATEPNILHSSDLVASLPAPFLRLLVLFARPLSFVRHALEVLSWRGGKRVQSWMVVGAWWAVCLGSGYIFMYLLPVLVFLPLLPLETLHLKFNSKSTPSNTPSEPSTSETLLVTLSDINAIYALLPPSPIPPTKSIYERFHQLGSVRLVRGFAVIWISWLALGHILGYRALLAVVGSIVLLLPSPPLAHLVHLLSDSLFFRRALALAFLFTFGSPPETSYRFSTQFSPMAWFKSKWTASRRPSLAFAFRPKMANPSLTGSAIADDEGADSQEAVEQPLYFRFEVHENQRWWMGLDWTSALLPQERPSWCDLHLQPVSPPSSFTLPAPSSVILPAPTAEDPQARVLRTATWKWLDDDWAIVRAGAGLAASSASAASAHVAGPTVPDADDHGYMVNHQRRQSNSSSRPTSFVSPFGSSPPKPSTATMEETLSPGARAQSIAEQAFTKGLEKLKARTASVAATATGPAATSPSRKSIDSVRGRTGSQASEDAHSHLEDFKHAQTQVQLPVHTETIVERDEATDADGWVYGDNKWESVGAKGGLGKFTRRRRWSRRAVLIETITKVKSLDEPVSSDTAPSGPEPEHAAVDAATSTSLSPLKARPAPAISDVQVQAQPIAEAPALSKTKSDDKPVSLGGGGNGESATSTGTSARDDVLRMRLKKAMGSVGG